MEGKSQTSKLESIIDSTKAFVKENKWYCIGMGAYTLTAITDAYLTSHGLKAPPINGDLSFEGNPIVRYFMENLGIDAGLAVHKASMGIAIATAAKGAEKLPKNKWLTRKLENFPKLSSVTTKKFWANSIIYGVSAAQALATASWTYLLYFH